MTVDVLIGCELSGRVRDAMIALGINAWSCDLEPCDRGGHHIRGDVTKLLRLGWAAAIFFPPCTYVCSSGLHRNKGNSERAMKTERAVAFVAELLAAPIDLIALENPIGCLSTRIRTPDQIIQPWQFGEDASKATCLWLKGLPKLVPTKIIAPRITADGKKRWANQTDSGQNRLPPSEGRAKERGLTYPGIAEAMAAQWAPTIMQAVPALKAAA